ncbi:MAG: hypothetical protein ACI37S_06450 [Candidatus Gastranaerophilaceae bacterium]
MLTESNLIKYFKTLGLEVNTKTKARGHLGFFLDGRIDISKNLPQNRVIPTLLHEFSHYIHSKIEKNISKTGGSLKILFNSFDSYEDELIAVTNFVDEHSKCETLFKHKEMVKSEIKKLDNLIKVDYPKFQRSKKFKEFDKAIRGTKLKYLLKYDRVKIMPWFIFGKEEIISINTLEQDFPKLKKAFVYYLKLKSLQRKQKRISNRISKIQRYYKRPTELFARFIEGLYIDKDTVAKKAPNAYRRFYELLNEGYFYELKTVFSQI